MNRRFLYALVTTVASSSTPAFADGPSATAAAEVGELTPDRFQHLAVRVARLADAQQAIDYNRLAFEIIDVRIADRLKDPAQFKKQREQKLRLWLELIREANDRIQKTWIDPKIKLYLNLDPGDGNPAGIDPAAVKDPEVRRRYQEAIRKNAENAKRSVIHSQLRLYANTWPNRMYDFVRWNFKKDNPEDQRELQKVLDEVLQDKELAKSLQATWDKLDQRYIVVEGGRVVRTAPGPAR